MPKILKEFRDFAVKGNAVDLAIGVIIGGAFGKIVSSLVSDVIMPPVGQLLGKVDFSNLFLSLNGQAYPSLAAAKAAGAPTLNYGMFLNTVLDFVIVAFIIFIVVQQLNRMKRQEPVPGPKPVTTKDCLYCFSAVPLKATRCAFCTSDLNTEAKALAG